MKKKIRPVCERPRHPDTGRVIDGEMTVEMDKGYNRMLIKGEIEEVVSRRKSKPQKGE